MLLINTPFMLFSHAVTSRVRVLYTPALFMLTVASMLCFRSAKVSLTLYVPPGVAASRLMSDEPSARVTTPKFSEASLQLRPM